MGATACYLCASRATIEGASEHSVTCAGVCGRYTITRQARRELGLIPGTNKGFIQGRRESILERIQKLRGEDADRGIRIARDLSIKFEGEVPAAEYLGILPLESRVRAIMALF